MNIDPHIEKKTIKIHDIYGHHDPLFTVIFEMS